MKLVGEESWSTTSDLMTRGQEFAYGFFNKDYVWLHFEEVVLTFKEYTNCYIVDGNVYITCSEKPTLVNSMLKHKKVLAVCALDNKIEILFTDSLIFRVVDPGRAILEDKVDIYDDENIICY